MCISSSVPTCPSTIMRLLIFSYLLGLALAEALTSSVIEIHSSSAAEAPLDNNLLKDYPWLNSHPFSLSAQFFPNFGKLGTKHDYLGFSVQEPILELDYSKSDDACGCQAQRPSTKPLPKIFELDTNEYLQKTPDKPKSSFYNTNSRPSNSTFPRSQSTNNFQESFNQSPSSSYNFKPSSYIPTSSTSSTYPYDRDSITSNSFSDRPSASNYPHESFTFSSGNNYQLSYDPSSVPPSEPVLFSTPNYNFQESNNQQHSVRQPSLNEQNSNKQSQNVSSFNPTAQVSRSTTPYYNIYPRTKNNEQMSFSPPSSVDQTVSEDLFSSFNANAARSTKSFNNPNYRSSFSNTNAQESINPKSSDDLFYSDSVLTPSNVQYYRPPPASNDQDLLNQQSSLSQPLSYDTNSNSLSSSEVVSNRPYYNISPTKNDAPVPSSDNMYSSPETANSMSAWSPNIKFNNMWPSASSNEQDHQDQDQRTSYYPNTNAPYPLFSSPTTSLSKTQYTPRYKTQNSEPFNLAASLDQIPYDHNSKDIFSKPEFSSFGSPADQTRPYRSTTNDFQQSTNPFTPSNDPWSFHNHNSNTTPSRSDTNLVYRRSENVHESYESRPSLTNNEQEFNPILPSYNPQSQSYDSEPITFYNPTESTFGSTTNSKVQDTFNPRASSEYNANSNQLPRPSTSRPDSTIPVSYRLSYSESNNSPTSDSILHRPSSLNDNESFNFTSSPNPPVSRPPRDFTSRFSSNNPSPYGTPTNQNDQDSNSSGYSASSYSYEPRAFSSGSSLKTLPPSQSSRNSVQEFSNPSAEYALPNSNTQSVDNLRTAARPTYTGPQSPNTNIQGNSPTETSYTSSHLHDPSYATSNPNTISSENAYYGYCDAIPSSPFSNPELPYGASSQCKGQQFSYPQFTSSDFNNSNFQFFPDSNYS